MARILIIDDSPTETHYVSGILQRHGHAVLSADSAEHGLSQVREHMPDLVLMDIVMPGLNGFQATRQLTRDPETKDIPVVMLTTKDQETDRVWGQRQGARDYLTKPVDEKRLIDTIERILG
jgi:twitching motility two-component system response regulator PilH